LVGLVTSATAIMYAFAPVSLAALKLRNPERDHPYRVPAPHILCPLGFVSANLIIYWGGFEATWKLLTGIFIGRIIFEIAIRRGDDQARPDVDWRAASWIWPWLIGMTIIGLVGRYGTGSESKIPEWWDLATVIAFSLLIFYYAVSLAMSTEKVLAAVAMEERQLSYLDEVNLPG
jgi:amino acid transporter